MIIRATYQGETRISIFNSTKFDVCALCDMFQDYRRVEATEIGFRQVFPSDLTADEKAILAATYSEEYTEYMNEYNILYIVK